MDLVEIDPVNGQPAQAVLALPANRCGPQVRSDLSVSQQPPALGEDKRPAIARKLAKRLAHNRL
jgi:hypothetical protein